MNSFAFASPMSLGKNHELPKSPLAPMVEKAETIIALSVATLKSAARAIENPAPAAGPGIAATTGFGSLRNAPDSHI